MSRTGIEPKPPWRSVPLAVRQGVDEVLGAPVQRAMRIWGGYSGTPTYRLRLHDGRRAFFKASSPETNDFVAASLLRELRLYENGGDCLSMWAPAFYGTFARGGWRVVLLEDLGPKSVPPWTPGLTRRIVHAFAGFHRATAGKVVPSWLPCLDEGFLSGSRLWQHADEAMWLRSAAELAGDRKPEALRWLESAAPVLARTSVALPRSDPPFVLVHGDARSDNLRWVKGRLYLFDWPSAVVGPPEEDLAAFAQSITVEGGPEPEAIVAWYAEVSPVREEVLDAAVAAIAGFFADGAWRPDIPGLPRLRAFQQEQMKVTLAWAARRLKLSQPEWLDAVAIKHPSTSSMNPPNPNGVTC